MTTTLINTVDHSAGNPEKLLLPSWAEIVKITPEAEGVSTFHLKFVGEVDSIQKCIVIVKFSGYPTLAEKFPWMPGITYGVIPIAVRC